MFDKNKPYNDLPLLPPKAELETTEVLKKVVTARASLAELRGIANTIPNQSILVNFLTLQEARSSSEIENIVTTNDKLFEAFSLDSENVDSSTKEVLRYREALWEGHQTLRERHFLTTNLFVRVCNIIKQNQAGIRKAPGITIANKATGERIYTPPEGEEVILKKLKNLEDYIHDENDGIDPLIKLAVIHYQFEAIHPFPDGNGRTGRIINVLYLVLRQLLDLPILYLSQYIIGNKDEYYKCIRQVTENNEWHNWLMYMLDGIEQTAISTKNKINEINDLFVKTVAYAKYKLPPHMYSKDLIELIFKQPYCKVKFLVENDIAQRQQASKYLKVLSENGILKEKNVGREKLYLNIKLFELLSNSDEDKNLSNKDALELFQTTDSRLEDWEEMFIQLEIFIQEHDHSSVSKRNPKTAKLGYWVTTQRMNRKNNLLSKEQINRLEEIGFDWEPIKNRWEQNYIELEKYKNTKGDCNVPQRFEENQQLASWVHNQRYRYKINKLSKTRINKLEKLGFSWGVEIRSWDDWFNELIAYNKKYGHLNVSQVDPDEEYRALGKWLNNQRHSKQKGTLNSELEKRLNAIGIAWNVLEAKWDEYLGELKTFFENNGHFRASQKGEHAKLGYWVAKIRRVQPSPERLKKLKGIGFDWEKERVKK